MKNNIAYFRYHIKSNLRVFLYITVIALLFTFVIGLTAQPQYRYTDAGRELYDYASTLYLPVIVLCFLCYLIPILQFSTFKKRRNLDCYYALPIKRTSVAVIHYLVGLLLVYLPFSICYLQNFILLLTRGSEYFYFAPMVAHYFLCLLIGFVLYSFFVFLFQEANSNADGIMFIFFYTFVFGIVFAALYTMDFPTAMVESWDGGFPWSVINYITTEYQFLVELSDKTFELWSDSGFIAWFIFWILIGILSAIGFFFCFGKRSTEKAEEVSDSWFGYRVMIPLLSACLLFITEFELIFYIITLILAFVGYTIYRRGFHYKKSDFIVLGILALGIFTSL